jgi:hypothetical protein
MKCELAAESNDKRLQHWPPLRMSLKSVQTGDKGLILDLGK